MGTPIPHRSNESLGIGTSPVRTYKMTPEELEDLEARTGKPQQGKQKAPLNLSRMAGRPQHSPAASTIAEPNKQEFLRQIANGTSISAVERSFGMKLNALHYWVKKWDLKGITPGKARELLAKIGEDPIAKAEDTGPKEYGSEPDPVPPEDGPEVSNAESPELRELPEGKLEAKESEAKEEIKTFPETDQIPIRVIQISIPLIDVGEHHTTQWLKSLEEIKEYSEEMHLSEIDFRKAVSELYDLNQTFAGLLRAQLARFIDTDIDSHILRFFEKSNDLHLAKIQEYAAVREWKVITV